jgi:hypothetical protein
VQRRSGCAKSVASTTTRALTALPDGYAAVEHPAGLIHAVLESNQMRAPLCDAGRFPARGEIRICPVKFMLAVCETADPGDLPASPARGTGSGQPRRRPPTALGSDIPDEPGDTSTWTARSLAGAAIGNVSSTRVAQMAAGALNDADIYTLGQRKCLLRGLFPETRSCAWRLGRAGRSRRPLLDKRSRVGSRASRPVLRHPNKDYVGYVKHTGRHDSNGRCKRNCMSVPGGK